MELDDRFEVNAVAAGRVTPPPPGKCGGAGGRFPSFVRLTEFRQASFVFWEDIF